MKYIVFTLVLWANHAAAQCLCVTCLNPAIDSYRAAAGSMEPTLPTGSCFKTIRPDDPASVQPGSVIAFEHPIIDAVFIKRLIATSGQTVQMIDGKLSIDDTLVPQTPVAPYVRLMDDSFPRCANAPVANGGDCMMDQFTETLGEISYNVLNTTEQSSDNTGLFTVPANHVFVLGDNRDNSNDSRVPQAARGVGFVPVENIIGTLIP